jgi:hypothetical protein
VKDPYWQEGEPFYWENADDGGKLEELDEDELEGYLRSPDEVKLTTEVWEEMNKDWLEAYEEKKKQEAIKWPNGKPPSAVRSDGHPTTPLFAQLLVGSRGQGIIAGLCDRGARGAATPDPRSSRPLLRRPWRQRWPRRRRPRSTTTVSRKSCPTAPCRPSRYHVRGGVRTGTFRGAKRERSFMAIFRRTTPSADTTTAGMKTLVWLSAATTMTTTTMILARTTTTKQGEAEHSPNGKHVFLEYLNRRNSLSTRMKKAG